MRPRSIGPHWITHTWHVGSLLILCLLPLAMAAAADAAGPSNEKQGQQSALQDGFEGKLGEGWSWLREEPQGWRFRDGRLEMRVGHGTIERATNVLLRDAPPTSQGPVVAEVTVSNDPTEQYEQCGMAWYYNDRQYVKLVKEVVDGPSWIVMGCALPEKGGLAGKLAFPKEDAAQLRFEVSGTRIEGKFRKAGQTEWTSVGTCQLPGGGKPKLALITFNGPEKTTHWARFDDFRLIVSKPPQPAASPKPAAASP